MDNFPLRNLFNEKRDPKGMGSNIPFMFHSSSPCEVYPGYGHSFHCAAGSGTNKNGKKHMTNPSRIEEHDDWMDLLWIDVFLVQYH